MKEGLDSHVSPTCPSLLAFPGPLLSPWSRARPQPEEGGQRAGRSWRGGLRISDLADSRLAGHSWCPFPLLPAPPGEHCGCRGRGSRTQCGRPAAAPRETSPTPWGESDLLGPGRPSLSHPCRGGASIHHHCPPSPSDQGSPRLRVRVEAENCQGLPGACPGQRAQTCRSQPGLQCERRPESRPPGWPTGWSPETWPRPGCPSPRPPWSSGDLASNPSIKRII